MTARRSSVRRRASGRSAPVSDRDRESAARSGIVPATRGQYMKINKLRRERPTLSPEFRDDIRTSVMDCLSLSGPLTADSLKAALINVASRVALRQIARWLEL